MDIPSAMEGVLFRNTFTKIIWVLLQPFFYAFRPLFLMPKPVIGLEIVNWVVQVFTYNLLYLEFKVTLNHIHLNSLSCS